MNKSIDTAKISGHRDVLLGIATLMIFLDHLPELSYDFKPAAFLLTGGKWLLTTGVDLFLFLSGMGLYCSMLKRSDIRGFYRKRAERVLPALLIVLILWAAVNRYGLLKAVKSISLLDFWTEGERITWYFALLLPLYILFPLLFRAAHSGKLKFPAAIAASFGLNMVLHLLAPAFYAKTIIALSRVPVFLCGVYFSRRMFTEKKPMKIPGYWTGISLAAALVCAAYILIVNGPYTGGWGKLYRLCSLLVGYGSMVYIRLPFTLCLLVLFCCLKGKDGVFSRAFVRLGGYSMEVYLVQERLQMKIAPLLSSGIAHKNSVLFDVISLVLTAAAALLLKKLSVRIAAAFRKSAPAEADRAGQ